jgi:hypothetical protein
MTEWSLFLIPVPFEFTHGLDQGLIFVMENRNCKLLS